MPRPSKIVSLTQKKKIKIAMHPYLQGRNRDYPAFDGLTIIF
ncbi:hypothetical protein B0I18_101245 [Taibaiella chishuiensis]|uniref:Uncharacterized protein n=1 Tax=Taibaiella chishuiensis TaxID=1434707 RepID=A0A2P8DA42_9BACT|nr:hypothetical protein B0I18_101245 [Taibaiella chishuiensis]